MNRREVMIGAGAAAAFGATAAVAPNAWAKAFVSDRISVEVQGQGPDVLLIPGLSSSREVWLETVKAVPGYRYHLVQLAGFAGEPIGGAGGPDGPVAAPVAEELARYVAAAGLNKPAVIGHSMGGTMAMMLAARHPEAVGKLMVVDMFPYMGVMFAAPPATPEQVRPTADAIKARMMSGPAEAYAAQQEATLDGMVMTKSALPMLVRHAKGSDRAVSARAFHELIVTDLRPELPKITAPTTVLYVWTPAYPFPPEQLDFFYKASFANLKGAKLVRVPDSFHFVMIDQPARFQAEVKALLQG